jgi:hypothetical protein
MPDAQALVHVLGRLIDGTCAERKLPGLIAQETHRLLGGGFRYDARTGEGRVLP